MIDLKLFRKEQNISQAELCSVLGVKQPYISSIENGNRPLNEEKFALLYKHYGNIILNYKIDEKPLILLDEVEASLHPETKKYFSSNLQLDSLVHIIESQQRTIESLSRTIENLSKK